MTDEIAKAIYNLLLPISIYQPKPITRTGVAADLATQHYEDLFTVVGGDIELLAIYGKVIAAKAATGQFLQLQHTPTGGALAALCGVSPTTTGDVIDSIYTITGVPGDLMIVAQVGPALGIGQLQINLLGTIRSTLVLVPGIIGLDVTVANDITGLINWTVLYRPLSINSAVTVL